MRLFNQLVFDEFVVGTTTVYTDPKWNAMLGSAERLLVEGVTDQVSGTTPTLKIQVQHTADNLNQNFQNKNGTPEINAVTISASATTVALGQDPPNASSAGMGVPSAGFVRLAITLGGTTPEAHVKVWATGRGEQWGP